MIVEEKKAADRVCPQMIDKTPEYRWCQGSRCMAWRWADNIVKHNKLELADGKSTTHGYCGLAGRP
jgi:hypothetical protein